jgi:hypothetical protein
MALDPLDELRFAVQVLGDAKRTVICPPGIEAELRQAVEAAGAVGWTVRGDSWVPEGTAYVIDEQAIEAETRETLQRWRHPI